MADQERGVDLAVENQLEQLPACNFCTCVWPLLIVRPFSMSAPIGNLSAMPP